MLLFSNSVHLQCIIDLTKQTACDSYIWNRLTNQDARVAMESHGQSCYKLLSTAPYILDLNILLQSVIQRIIHCVCIQQHLYNSGEAVYIIYPLLCMRNLLQCTLIQHANQEKIDGSTIIPLWIQQNINLKHGIDQRFLTRQTGVTVSTIISHKLSCISFCISTKREKFLLIYLYHI